MKFQSFPRGKGDVMDCGSNIFFFYLFFLSSDHIYDINSGKRHKPIEMSATLVTLPHRCVLGSGSKQRPSVVSSTLAATCRAICHGLEVSNRFSSSLGKARRKT